MTQTEYINYIRQYLKDTSDYNKLISGEEFSNDDISLSLDMAVNTWNSIGKKTQHSLESIPMPYLLILLAVSYLLEMGGVRRERNRLTYSDGGVSATPDDKLQTYFAAANNIRQFVIPQIQKYKTEMVFGYGVEMEPPPPTYLT